MAEQVNPRLRRVLLDVVNKQLRDGTPPETASTLERLIREGYERKQAIELIACALASEIFDILKNQELYNESRYIAALEALPRMPWEEGKGDAQPSAP